MKWENEGKVIAQGEKRESDSRIVKDEWETFYKFLVPDDNFPDYLTLLAKRAS